MSQKGDDGLGKYIQVKVNLSPSSRTPSPMVQDPVWVFVAQDAIPAVGVVGETVAGGEILETGPFAQTGHGAVESGR